VPPGDVLRKYRLVLRFRAENRRLVSRWSRPDTRATARVARVWRSGADGLARPRATRVTVWG